MCVCAMYTGNRNMTGILETFCIGQTIKSFEIRVTNKQMTVEIHTDESENREM